MSSEFIHTFLSPNPPPNPRIRSPNPNPSKLAVELLELLRENVYPDRGVVSLIVAKKVDRHGIALYDRLVSTGQLHDILETELLFVILDGLSQIRNWDLGCDPCQVRHGCFLLYFKLPPAGLSREAVNLA